MLQHINNLISCGEFLDYDIPNHITKLYNFLPSFFYFYLFGV